jgi:integrase/recombinase XerC
LADPPATWLRPRKPTRDERLAPTQVLTAPLSAQSIAHARSILGGMCSYLQDAGYLQFNVFKLSSKPAVVTTEHQARALNLDSWFWLWEWLCTAQTDDARSEAAAARSRWIFALLYHSGLRRDEVARGSMGDFVRADNGWRLRVVGKGNKERMVAINSVLQKELVRYRKSWAFSDLPLPGDSFPLVANINQRASSRRLTPRSIGLIIHKTAQAAAIDCPDPYIRDQILRVSTHWMRHTNATHRLAAGATLETTQDELGHSDPRTTRIYAKPFDNKRREDAQKLADFQPDQAAVPRPG